MVFSAFKSVSQKLFFPFFTCSALDFPKKASKIQLDKFCYSVYKEIICCSFRILL